MRVKLITVVLSAAVCLTVLSALFLFPPERTDILAESQVMAASSPDKTAENKETGEAVVQPASISSSIAIQGMEKAAENDALALFMNNQNAEIAVYDKRSGKAWYSNPQDREGDTKATPFEKESLSSQFAITFIDPLGNKKTFLSFNDSVKNNQFEIVPIAGGIRITYTLGDTSKGINVLPKLISKKRLDQFMAKADKEKANYVYRKYELKDNVYERFDESINSEIVLKRVVDAFQQAGYTPEDLAQDNTENGITDGDTNLKPVFTVPVEYKLDGEHLVVSVSTGQLKEPRNNVISEIALFKHFAAAGIKDQGYMFVPDGSGSLIYLNNGKFKDDIYSQPVYGSDESIRRRAKEQNSETARLPVFGIKTSGAASYGIIEKGAAVANINAEVSGRTNSYNYVYGSFKIRNLDELPLSNGRTFNYITVLQSRKVQGELAVRYGFLYGDDAGYEGMAKVYQDYLVQNYSLKRIESSKKLPFFLDLVGSIPKRKSFLGIPYEAMVPLTTFSQAQKITNELKGSGINHIKLRYLGWFNQGVNHKLPTSITVDGKLGGKAGLQQLKAYLNKIDVDFYPDVSLTRVFHDTWGFSPSKDASRYITRQVVEKYPYDLSFLRANPELGSYYLLSPSKLPSYVNKYLSSYKHLDIEGLSLRYMGEELNPDYRVGQVIDRAQSEKIVTAQLKKLSAQLPDLLVTGGNAYALPYADNLVDVPLSDTRFNITDETVPFYQMVVHGYFSYAGKPFNLSDDQDVGKNMLKAIEYGANVRFTWIYDDAATVKDTEFNHLYSVQYNIWLEDAKRIYEKVNEALQDVQDERMIGHKKIQEGVYATTYENGKTILVNYTDHPVTVNGISVEANHFTVGG